MLESTSQVVGMTTSLSELQVCTFPSYQIVWNLLAWQYWVTTRLWTTQNAWMERFWEPAKTNKIDVMPQSKELPTIDLTMQCIMLSESWSPEWTTRAIKAPFQHLNTVLICDTQKRGIIIELACRLLKFWTSMGMSQILTTYSSSPEMQSLLWSVRAGLGPRSKVREFFTPRVGPAQAENPEVSEELWSMELLSKRSAISSGHLFK